MVNDVVARVEALAKRREEAKRIADDLRVLHKVAGGVCILFIEEDQCPFGFAVPDNVKDSVLSLLPGKLRELADTIERGVPLTTRRSLVP